MADEEEEVLQYEIDAILRHRDRRGVREYWVHWKGYPDEENSWVANDDMACPELLVSYLETHNEMQKDRLRKSRTPAGNRESSAAPSTSSRSSKKWKEPVAPPSKRRKAVISSPSASPPSSPRRSPSSSAVRSEASKEPTDSPHHRRTTSPSPLPSSRRDSPATTDTVRKSKKHRSRQSKAPVVPVAPEAEPITPSNLWETLANHASVKLPPSPSVELKKKSRSEAPIYRRKSEVVSEKVAPSEPIRAENDAVEKKKKSRSEVPADVRKSEVVKEKVASSEPRKAEIDTIGKKKSRSKVPADVRKSEVVKEKVAPSEPRRSENDAVKKKKKKSRSEVLADGLQSEIVKEKVAPSETRRSENDKIPEKQNEAVSTAKEPATVAMTEEEKDEEPVLVIDDRESPEVAQLVEVDVASRGAVTCASESAVAAVAKNHEAVALDNHAVVKPDDAVASKVRAVVFTDDISVASDDSAVSAAVRRRVLEKHRYAARCDAKETFVVLRAAAEDPSILNPQPGPSNAKSVEPSEEENAENERTEDFKFFKPSKYPGEESVEEEEEEEEEEENDDDLSDYEDLYGDGDETKIPLREDMSKNPYERGLKSHKILFFTRFRGEYYAAVKFHGSNVIENIGYSMVRRLDPILLANYYVKMHKRCLARGIDVERPGGPMELLSDEESDDDF